MKGKYRNTKQLPLYPVWKAMISRCTNPKNKSFKNYGAKGIRVCKRWIDSYFAFVSDMGPRPDGLTVERKNNLKGYCPSNCHWASRKSQMRNTSINRILTLDGRSQPLVDWAIETGIPNQTIRSRLHYGWSVERTLTEPVQPKSQAWRRLLKSRKIKEGMVKL